MNPSERDVVSVLMEGRVTPVMTHRRRKDHAQKHMLTNNLAWSPPADTIFPRVTPAQTVTLSVGELALICSSFNTFFDAQAVQEGRMDVQRNSVHARPTQKLFHASM